MFEWLKNLFAVPLDRRTEGYNFGKKQIAAGRANETRHFVDAAHVFGIYDEFDAGIEDALKESNDA